MKRKIRTFFEEHLAFILAFFITYILGILIVTIVFLISKNNSAELYSNYESIKIYIEFITPTTFAYVLTNGVTNLMQMPNRRKSIWNWFAIILSIVYALLFIIYQLSWSELAMVIVMFVFTFALIVLNFYGYREYYLSVKRNHSISASP